MKTKTYVDYSIFCRTYEAQLRYENIRVYGTMEAVKKLAKKIEFLERTNELLLEANRELNS